jgi:hypothetical protein
LGSCPIADMLPPAPRCFKPRYGPCDSPDFIWIRFTAVVKSLLRSAQPRCLFPVPGLPVAFAARGSREFQTGPRVPPFFSLLTVTPTFVPKHSNETASLIGLFTPKIVINYEMQPRVCTCGIFAGVTLHTIPHGTFSVPRS